MEIKNKNREIAIQLSGVKKMYKLGQIGGGTLQKDLQSWWARAHGKEDPNTKIGQDQRLVGQTFMALNGINLTVYKGEALGIIGSNGAGKSTMLKLLSRITAPTEGEIDIYGRIASMLEVGTGFNGEMTGRENIYMNGTILGMTKREIDTKIEDIIEFSEVREFIDTPVKRYSSGMYVKLAFSVAAHLDSEIMIMDEVLAVGDMAFQNKCLTKMREASNRDGRTILYVSHNMNTIRQLCDRCIVLDKGKIVFDGDVTPAIEQYMDHSKKNDIKESYVDYIRPAWLTNQKVRILSTEYCDKEDICFSNDETMRIRLKWENLEQIHNMGIRLEVWTVDNVAQATYIAYDFYSGGRGEVTTCLVDLDLHQLTPASYQFHFTMFYSNDLGQNQDIDCVPGLCFDIVEAENGDHTQLLWRPNNWGYVRLNPPLIHAMHREKQGYESE